VKSQRNRVKLMSRNKTQKTKSTLGKMINRNRRIPLFVIAKTNRRVVQNRERRNWRSQKLKMRSQKRHRLN
jgi:large subunit ribosomal protein L39e